MNIPHDLHDQLDGNIGGFSHVLPELVLTAGFLFVIVADLLWKRTALPALLVLFLALSVASCLTAQQYADVPAAPLFGGMLRVSRAALGFKLVFYVVTALTAVFASLDRELCEHKKGTGDFLALLLAVTLGMSLMAEAANLLMIFLSVEFVSIGSYLLVGYTSNSGARAEAAMKYALFGAACSAVMLYGMSLLYALTGTLDLFDPAFMKGLHQASLPASGVALTLVMAGIAFKLSVVPAHAWSPDVYEGAPAPVMAFLSSGPKLAGFALLPVLLGAIATTAAGYPGAHTFLAVLGIATMIAGNFGAIWQDNVKRMLAYSSIGHSGFMVMAVIAGAAGLESLLFYGLVYALAIFAALLIAAHIAEETGATKISEYKGFGKQFAVAMTAFVIVLVSLTGIPPTAGFFAKLLVFRAVWEHYRQSASVWDVALLITGVVTTVVSLFYYFRIALNAWLREGNDVPGARALSPKIIVAAALTALLIIFGLFPGVAAAF